MQFPALRMILRRETKVDGLLRVRGFVLKCIIPFSRWLFLASLMYAPWAYGTTDAITIHRFNCILAAVLVLWGCALPFRTNYRFIPTPVVLIVAVLILGGWWMVVNAHSIYDSDYFLFIPLQPLMQSAPGSIDRSISAATMVRISLLVGVSCFVSDLAQRRVWLLRLWRTIGLAGASIAFLGLLEKATGAEMIFWGPSTGVRTFFATFYYHANAGAFLNLTFPLTFALLGRTYLKNERPRVRALWLTGSTIMFIAVAANTSRMSQFIASLIIGAMGVIAARPILHMTRRGNLKQAFVGLMAATLALGALAQASHLEQAVVRWRAFDELLFTDSRWLVLRAALRALPDAGSFGFGPGTFHVVFPYYTRGLGERIEGIWLFLHDDYVQTLLEWGWAGTFFWLLLGGGTLALALKNLRCAKRAGWRLGQRLLVSAAFLATLGVALHATVDFPLQVASIQLYTATYGGLFWGSYNWNSSWHFRRHAQELPDLTD